MRIGLVRASALNASENATRFDVVQAERQDAAADEVYRTVRDAVAPRLHDRRGVAETRVSSSERRRAAGDRRMNSRSGRRTGDPHVNWRRIAWLFAAYAVYLSIRSLPAAVKRLFSRTRA